MKRGGYGQYPHRPARTRVLIMVAVFFQNRDNNLGQSMADRILINIMRRKTKPKLVTKIRYRKRTVKLFFFDCLQNLIIVTRYPWEVK